MELLLPEEDISEIIKNIFKKTMNNIHFQGEKKKKSVNLTLAFFFTIIHIKTSFGAMINPIEDRK